MTHKYKLPKQVPKQNALRASQTSSRTFELRERETQAARACVKQMLVKLTDVFTRRMISETNENNQGAQVPTAGPGAFSELKT